MKCARNVRGDLLQRDGLTQQQAQRSHVDGSSSAAHALNLHPGPTRRRDFGVAGDRVNSTNGHPQGGECD